jgi:predicted DNA-binding transcriptional regulator YafY
MAERTTEMPKYQRLVEIYAHLIRNRRRKYTVEDVRSYLEQSGPVSLRNVQRDLKDLSETNVSGVTSEIISSKKHYFIQPDMRSKLTLPLQQNSMLAFFLLKRLQPFFAAKAKTIEDLSQVILDLTGETDWELFEDLDEKLEESTFLLGEHSPLAIDGNLFNDLLTSLVKHRRLKILYHAAGKEKPTKKIVCPAKLILFKGELYFVCMSEYNPDHDFYIKLCRIMGAELMPETFEPDPKRIKRIEDRLVTSFGIFDQNVPKTQKVVVRFPAGPYYQHIFTEKKFHNSQKVSVDKKGDVLVTMSVPVGLDLINWVLSWPEAVVMEPEGLKKEMLVVAKTLMEKYGK